MLNTCPPLQSRNAAPTGPCFNAHELAASACLTDPGTAVAWPTTERPTAAIAAATILGRPRVEPILTTLHPPGYFYRTRASSASQAPTRQPAPTGRGW